jgi:hypothetical protein
MYAVQDYSAIHQQVFRRLCVFSGTSSIRVYVFSDDTARQHLPIGVVEQVLYKKGRGVRAQRSHTSRRLSNTA